MSAFVAPVSSGDHPARPAGAWRPARCRENSRRLGLGRPAFGAGAAIPCSFTSLLSVPVRKQQHEQHNHEHEEREPRFVRVAEPPERRPEQQPEIASRTTNPIIPSPISDCGPRRDLATPYGATKRPRLVWLLAGRPLMARVASPPVAGVRRPACRPALASADEDPVGWHRRLAPHRRVVGCVRRCRNLVRCEKAAEATPPLRGTETTRGRLRGLGLTVADHQPPRRDGGMRR